MNRDFLDMLGALKSADAEFLVVGAHALAAHGRPRATGDLDIWIDPTPDNVQRVWSALLAFGAPLDLLSPDDFLQPDCVIQFGVEPGRIDLLTSITGVRFDEAWPRRNMVEVAGLTIPVLGKVDLVRNKRATGRPKDQIDADELER
ncbi:MAG: hypothetical protein WDZ31_01475 [Phycisphaeraceae bacterium]